MKIIIGLGNPGLKYAKTRHNLGFRVIKRLASDLGVKVNKRDHSARYAEARIEDNRVLLAMPQTFMNRSGTAVRQLSAYYKTEISDIVILHDDLDLPVGDVRVKKGGGSAGHNGLRSLIENLDSNEFIRVRIGIGRPPGSMDAADYVLRNFSRQETELIDVAIVEAAEAVVDVVSLGVEAAMNRFNSAESR